jgi:hypothetical protein
MRKNRVQATANRVLSGLAFLAAAGCSSSQPNQTLCSNIKSLVRFDQPSVNLAASGMLEEYQSVGGFIEVYTRKELLGRIDSSRLCTAYIEFSDNPLGEVTPAEQDPLELSIYTASHCLDLARDYRIKLHFFNGSAYQNIWLSYAPLTEANALRKAMIKKQTPKEEQQKILNSLRSAAANVDELFRTTGGATSTNTATKAANICLKGDDTQNQNICATFQDLSHFKATVASDSLPATVAQLKQNRTFAVEKIKSWIGATNLKNFANNNPNFRFSMANENNQLTLAELHQDIRMRSQKYTALNAIKHMSSELEPVLLACDSGDSSPVCRLRPELSTFLRAQLVGTGYENFEDSQLATLLQSLPAALNQAFTATDRAFTTFYPFIENTGSVQQLGLATRIHSNYRFVTATEPTADEPNPKDSVDTGRAFMQFNANNLTGDSSGAGVSFIKWSNTSSSSLLGRFLHLAFPKTMTDEVRVRPRSSPVATIGFMQAGDSGSIAVVEHIPFFAITSVDGKATSGGAAIRPLPEPIDDPEFESAPKSNSLNCLSN